jgi:hypothetical protein
MPTPGVTLVKTFTYRGLPEDWANTYAMTTAPTTPALWRTAIDGLIAQEKTLYSNRVTIYKAYCYADLAAAVTYVYDLALFAGVVPGTFSGSAGAATPGDVAGWVRWDTGRRSSRGKPVYLRKYFHDVEVNGAPNQDQVTSTQLTAYNAFGTALLSALGGGFALADPHTGALPPGPRASSSFATTRTLERRGKRP